MTKEKYMCSNLFPSKGRTSYPSIYPVKFQSIRKDPFKCISDVKYEGTSKVIPFIFAIMK